jgi:hypothetical protein
MAIPRVRVLVVLPTEWDRMQVPPWQARQDVFEAVFGELGDADCPDDLDPLAYAADLAAIHGGAIQGVVSSSDYPGATLAGLVASDLGLAGARPEVLLRASHKYYARVDQARVAPEATPPFVLLRPGGPLPTPFPLPFPCFVKPVKGAFSRFARRVQDEDDLRRFLETPEVRGYVTDYVAIFNQLLVARCDLEHDGSCFLAEGLLAGRQVTVEGFVRAGRATILGTVDSTFHPGTHSFSRFDYPSHLPAAVLARLERVAARVARASGLDNTLFNVEMTFELATGRIGVIELNPRMCGQFADLYEKVDGTNSYEIAFALATGQAPRVRRREGAFAAAASIPLRTLRPVRVLEAPDDARLGEVRARYPDVLVLNECRPGDRLDRFTDEDGESIRYGVVNLGGRRRADVFGRAVEIVEALGYRFEPLA